MTELVHGYKVFNADWTCAPNKDHIKQYTCPGKFEEDVIPIVGAQGMHYCRNLMDCFGTSSFSNKMKVAKVIAYGDIDEDIYISCTNKLEIVEEVPFDEVIEIVNTNKENNGYGNTGECNVGNLNSGSWNNGNSNVGHNNNGSFNCGRFNIGNGNTGHCNIGDRNVGSWNITNGSNGSFCTKEHKIYLFDKLSHYTYKEWEESLAYCFLCGLNPNKRLNQKWWDERPQNEKDVILNIENFDAEIFKQCTGIDVTQE